MASIPTVNASSNAPLHPNMNRVWEGLRMHILLMLQNHYPSNIAYYNNEYQQEAEIFEGYADDICNDNYDGVMSECASVAVKEDLWSIAKSLPDDVEMFFRVPREEREGLIRDYFINWGIHTEIREALSEEAINCFIDSCELLRGIFLYGEDGATLTCLANDANSRAILAEQGKPDRKKHIVELTKLALPETQANADDSWESYFRTLLLVTYDEPDSDGQQESKSLVTGAVSIQSMEETAQIQVSLAMWLITIEALFDLDSWVVDESLREKPVNDDDNDGDNNDDGTVGWQTEMLGKVAIFNTDEYTTEEKEFSTLPFRRARREYIIPEEVANAMFAAIQAYNRSLREQFPVEMPQLPEEVDTDSGITEEDVPVDSVTEKLAALAAFYPEL